MSEKSLPRELYELSSQMMQCFSRAADELTQLRRERDAAVARVAELERRLGITDIKDPVKPLRRK